MEPSSSTSSCKVCNEPAHGVHFGVLSCRACAAFFRRSTVLSKKYVCKKKVEKCTASDDKLQCRYCRFRKCLDVGMTPENVKYNYDTVINIRKPSPKMKCPNRKNDDNDNNEVAVKDVTYEVQMDSKGEKIVKLDISGLLNNITNVLEDFYPPPDVEHVSNLRKMEKGLFAYREIHHSNVIKFVHEISLRDILLTSNDQIKTIAKFLMYSDRFRALCVEDRMLMLKSIWVQWKRLERYTSTAQIFGKRMYEEQIMTLIPGVAAHLNNLKVDCTNFIYKKAEGMKYFMENFNTRMMEEVGKPLVELDLSTLETAFMLAQLAWQVAGKEIQGDVLRASEKEQEQMANDLHCYYTNELKYPNYAARLIKIMNVINAAQKIHFERQSMMDLIRIFDYFRVKVSDPELYKSYF